MATNFDAVTFDSSNPEPRCACVLLLDTSISMDGAPIQALNEGLVAFHGALNKDDLARLRVEIAVITFGGSPIIVQEFVTADQYNPPKLTAGGGTPMGAAINLALDQIEQRKSVYRRNRVPFFRPWVFLITDGEPTDGVEWQSAAQRVQAAEAGKKVAFFAVFVGEGAGFELLNKIGPRQAVKLKGLDFQNLFQWLSISLTNSASQDSPDKEVPLQSPIGWAKV